MLIPSLYWIKEVFFWGGWPRAGGGDGGQETSMQAERPQPGGRGGGEGMGVAAGRAAEPHHIASLGAQQW